MILLSPSILASDFLAKAGPIFRVSPSNMRGSGSTMMLVLVAGSCTCAAIEYRVELLSKF